MKIAIVSAAALVVLSSIPMLAQQAGASVQQNATASGGSHSVSESSSGSASASRAGIDAQGAGSASAAGAVQMSNVNGELVGKLDSKSARVGDEVVVKTTEKAQTADGVTIPKGSRLIGHVASVQAHNSSSADSSMSVVFDRLDMRSGERMPIHSTIQSVNPAASATAPTMASGDETLSGGMGGGGMVRGGGMGTGMARGSAGGGGLIGGTAGAVGGSARGAGSTVGAAGSEAVSTTGSAAHSTASATGRAAGDVTTTAGKSVGNGLHGAASGTGSLAAHATGVRGVMLAGDASGSTSGTLSATRSNVHLDSGTQMTLGLASSVNR
jgi:hypothetical protein